MPADRSRPTLTHTFVEWAPLLIRSDFDIGRICWTKLSAALEPLGLRAEMTMEGFRIEPVSGTSARTN
jgi:hypothetical protein